MALKDIQDSVMHRYMEEIDPSRVIVLIPTLNEERSIAEVIRELKSMGLANILVIDGNSRDKTARIAEKLGVNLIHQNGHGKGDALRQALSYDGVDGDFVVIMDADGSMNPKEVSSFIKALEYGADLVKGSRFLLGGDSEDMTLFRRIGNLFFVFMVNSLWSARYTDLCYGYAAFKKDAVERLQPHLKSRNFEIEAEMFIKARKLGFRIEEVPSVELRRKHGKSNLRAYKDGFRILKVIIGEVFHGVG